MERFKCFPYVGIGKGLKSVAHSSKEYMRDFRARQRIHTAAQQEAYNRNFDLLDEFVQDRLNESNVTEDQAIGQFISGITPPSEDSVSNETSPVGTAADSVCSPATNVAPDIKPKCFGVTFRKDSEPCDCSFRKDCDKVWMTEYLKSKDEKDMERTLKIVDLLASSKAFVEGMERREQAELWAECKAITDAQEKELDSIVEKYVARGIPKAQAEESARWEIRQKQRAMAVASMKAREKWDLLSDEQKLTEKGKLLADNKKLREKYK